MPRRFRPQIWVWPAAGLAMAALLAACGGGSSAAAKTAPTSAAPAASQSNNGGSGGRGGFGASPGAFGTVAAITGTQMEVQNQQTGQVTVIWTPTTTFTRTATVAATAITPGVCVTATGTKSGTTLTARTVAISQPSSSGSCTVGRFGARFGGGNGPAGTPPRSLPQGTPRRTFPQGAGRALANLSFAGGKVTSVSGSKLVVSGFSFSGFGGRASGSKASTPPTSAPATTVTINLSSSTTYTETQKATSSNLAVGDCVTANGSTGSTGAVTAKRIAISPSTNGSCTTGFGRFVGGPASGAPAQ